MNKEDIVKVYIKTYGCTLNQADSDIMAGLLKNNGAELADEKEADVIVMNTCSVKKPTEQRILDRLRELDRQGRRVVVAGCMAKSKEAIWGRAHNASILTTSNVQRVGEAVSTAYAGGRAIFDGDGRPEKLSFFSPSSGVIARVPVSEGCLSSCSFCETKYARGQLNSFSEQLILKAIEGSVSRGAREVQLTSQDMGAYGADKKTNIAELMKKIALLDGDFSVRVGMLNPEHLHRYFGELVEAMQSERFYKFVHLPVQAGSNRVLQQMGRHYTAEKFCDYVKELRETVPGIAIETDIIVGYPTESLSDFDATIDMLKEARPDVTNISKYCARPHARASKLKPINNNEMSRRSLLLSRLVRSMQKEKNSRFIGSSMDVLITESTGRSTNGRTSSYKQVVLPGIESELGGRMSVSICAASANVLYGRLT